MMDTRNLGDYILIKQVGHGSMGSVFLAEHRFMKKQYILKVLPEELASDRGFVQRLEDEVAFLASLEHPHIVKIHTVSFAQGQYFLVTDCVVDEFGETTNLGQYIHSRGKRFDEATSYRLLRQISEALDYAHNKKSNGKGIAHHNLKLNNILVAKGRGGIDLMISDFGLTKIIGPSAVLCRNYKAVAEYLGIAGAIFGPKPVQDRYPNPPIDPQKLLPLNASFLQNFAFLAPEQKRLDSEFATDTKVDAFAFGILSYYLLTGDFPEGCFELPSKLHSDLSWNWDLLISQCLNPNPQQRPDDLVTAIEAIRQPVKISTVKEVLTKEQSAAIVKGRYMKELSIEKQQVEILKEEIPQPVLREIPKPEELPESISLPDIMNMLDRALNENSGDQKEESMIELEKVEEAVKKATFSAAMESSHVKVVGAVSSPIILPKQREIPASTHALKPIIRTAQIERPTTDHDPAAAFQIDTTVKHYTPERKEVKNTQPIQTDMIVITGGTFNRGSMDGNRDEMPKHHISLSSFAIDIHPVTNEQFVRFLEVMGGEKDSNHQDIIRMRDSRIKRMGGKLSIESGYSKHPVVGVTWYGAIAYAKWVGKRLPTEAEWEVAARGGYENLLYPTGDDIEKTQANFFSSDTTAAMSYAPNGYGLYDIAGNVYEWCHDWYGYNYYETSIQEPDNPTGPLQGVYRVLRGGCWKSLKEDLRCSRRHRNNPGTVNGTYGFRCATDVQ
jgi:formylglycine-generating enzyme required for sulfatase activity